MALGGTYLADEAIDLETQFFGLLRQLARRLQDLT
jgi:hypothetical protein